MPVYEYRGKNQAGKKVKGIETAETKQSLRRRLQKKGIFVTDVFEGDKDRKGSSREVDLLRVFKRITLTDVAVLTRQLATLLRAGIPLVDSLSALTDQAEKEDLKRVLSDIRRKVNEGSSLANALEDHDQHFSNLYVNMVRAGENSGNLDVVLERLTEFLDNKLETRGKIMAAMFYPVLMVGFGLLVMMFIFVFVIPKVTAIFEDQGEALPVVTQVMIAFSNFLANWWFVLLPAVIGGCFLFWKWKNSPEGKDRWDRYILKVPLFGTLVRMVAISRFAGTLSTLLASGVPLLTAMNIVKNVLGNNRLEEVIEDARVNIREGESIAKPLQRSGEFPPLVTHMIATGERSGQLEEMLENVAHSYQRRTDRTVETMTQLLGPIMIIVLGVAVGFIVMAVMWPLLQMNQTIM